MIQLSLLLLCFFASGFAALLYQTAWTREFSTVFGTSELSIASVLAAYMAGLALGAAVAGRYVDRVRRPVLAYGVLELGIALGALAVPLGIRAVTLLYVEIFSVPDALPEGESLLRTLFQVGGAFAVLMPPAAMMGATLPLLARHAVRHDREIGPRIGVLYAVNTAGAIAGTACAGFWLLPALGLRGTIYIGVALNALVFLAAAGLARGAEPVGPATGARSIRGPRWILVAMLFSGIVSFSYEVLWARLLGQVIGGSTPAFATMLASFLLGIALGSAAASRFARSVRGAALGFAWVQIGAAGFAWLALRLADQLPVLARELGASAYDPEIGAPVALAVLLPLTLCLGATFPFAVRLHTLGAQDVGAASARVYAWNTVGSIIGAVSAGLWLIPLLAFEGVVIAGATTCLALALLAAYRVGVARVPIASVAALGALVLLVAPPRSPDELLRTSPLNLQIRPGELVWTGVGRSSTVTLFESGAHWRLATNGLPEAWIEPPEYPPAFPAEADFLGLLPVLVRPDAEHVLLIGLGGGKTLRAVPETVDAIELVELEPRVLDANRIATPRLGGDPLDDPRVRVHVGDARGAMLLSPSRYDAIVSQPSHPWTAGASNLYTRDFFALVRDHLTDDGVLVQWMGGAFVSPPLLRSLLASLLDVFDHVELIRPDATSLIFVGSQQPLNLLETTREALAMHGEVLRGAGIHRLEDVAATYGLDTDGARAVAANARILTDDHNPLGKGLVRGLRARSLGRLLAPHDKLTQVHEGLEFVPLARRLSAMSHAARLSQLIETLDDEAMRAAALGWLAHDRSQPESATLRFEESLALDPMQREARLGLLANARDLDAESSLSPEEALLSKGAKAAEAEDWKAVRSLDAELARYRPTDLVYPEVTRLRVDSRLAMDDPAAAAEALDILDESLRVAWRGEDLLRRARVLQQMGRDDLAWTMIEIMGERLPNSMTRVRKDALALSETLAPHPRAAALRDHLRRRPIYDDSEDLGE